MRIVDLFAGTGAFSFVFEKNKCETVFANDILESSEKIYNLNNKCKLTKKDIKEIKEDDIPEFDILTSGFPCQPFSIAGMQKGFEDERSNVFWKIISIIKRYNPKIIILENVKNLKTHDNGKTFEIIIKNVEEQGYNIKYGILNTCKITNIPQNRERIYIICFKNKEMYERFDLNFKESESNLLVSDVLEKEMVDDKYYYKEGISKIYKELEEKVVKKDTVYQYRRKYVRENKSKLCPTLTANMGTGGNNVPIIRDNKGIRKLTPRECFNLQGFPKEYQFPKDLSDSKLYSLAGNTVSLPLIELIVKKLIELF